MRRVTDRGLLYLNLDDINCGTEDIKQTGTRWTQGLLGPTTRDVTRTPHITHHMRLLLRRTGVIQHPLVACSIRQHASPCSQQGSAWTPHHHRWLHPTDHYPSRCPYQSTLAHQDILLLLTSVANTVVIATSIVALTVRTVLIMNPVDAFVLIPWLPWQYINCSVSVLFAVLIKLQYIAYIEALCLWNSYQPQGDQVRIYVLFI